MRMTPLLSVKIAPSGRTGQHSSQHHSALNDTLCSRFLAEPAFSPLAFVRAREERASKTFNSTMVGVPECIVCNYPYDLGVHEPMSLSCGHSVCRQCWEEWSEKRGATCPNDRQPVTSAVNYGLRDMLQHGTACDKHPTEMLEYVCPDDEVACCARCIIIDHHGHHRPLQLDFPTLKPMFEAAIMETQRRLNVVEAIEGDAQRICADAGELVRNVVARRDELLRAVLPGYIGGLPWSFGQQPIQGLDTSEVRMLHDRLNNLVQAQSDPAAAFMVYKELKEALHRCLPHIPPVPQGAYDPSGLDNVFGTIHSWGSNSRVPLQQPLPIQRLAGLPQYPPVTPTGLAIVPPGMPVPNGYVNSPIVEATDAPYSPSLFAMPGFPGVQQSPSHGSAMPPIQPPGMPPSPSHIDPAGSNAWFNNESSMSSPTDSPHRALTSAVGELAISASPARNSHVLETVTAPQASTPSRAAAQNTQTPPQAAVQAQNTQAQADDEGGEEFRGVIACLLNETHDEGFCEVRGPNRQSWNVYFNLHGGKVATVNLSGFEPAILEAGYEVFVKLADNPDRARASTDPARKYVARSMRLGSPAKPVRGIVQSTWNEGQDGFVLVESPDGHTKYRVYFRFGLGGAFKTGYDPKSLNPTKLRQGMPVHVTLMENPQKDKAKQDETRKYVARNVKHIGS